MIYAVNRKTKEHRVVPRFDVLSNADWRYIEADADGWIERKGGSECPLPDGQPCEVTDKRGDVTSYKNPEIQINWIAVKDYRPILEPQGEQVKGDSLGSPQDHPAYRDRFGTGKVDTSDKGKEWRGPEDGLPPVGVVCEVYIANRDAWVETEVKAHVDGLALFKNGTGGHYYGRTAEHYRPIRTDRERWIEAALKESEDNAYEWMGKLFDAGLARLPGE